jgi:hypothetical protein
VVAADDEDGHTELRRSRRGDEARSPAGYRSFDVGPNAGSDGVWRARGASPVSR